MKIFKKASSIILAIAIILVSAFCGYSIISSITTEYYVSAEGSTENDGSEESPLLTIADAINLANNQKLPSDQTLTVKVLGEAQVDWGLVNSKLPEHSFKLIITSASSEGGATVGNGTSAACMGGDVVFDNIKINFGKTYKHIYSYGHNVTFTESCGYVGNTAMSNYSIGAPNGDYKVTFDNDIKFECNFKLKLINLINNYTECFLNGRLDVIYNCASVTPTFYISAYDDPYVINNAININIKASKGANFTKYSGGDAPIFGENGYIQVLNSGSVAVSIADTDLKLAPANKVWVLNNSLATTNLLSSTDTKGKFAVNTSLYMNVKATSDTDSSVVISEKDGYLELPAGQYTITAERAPQYGTYYVSANGSDQNDGKTENTAVATVQRAIEIANSSNFILGDTVTVKLLGETVNMGNMPAYEYNLVVEGSKTQESVTRLVMNGNKTIANSQAKGLTTYKTVDIYASGTYSRFEATSSDIVFESDAKFSGSFHQLVFGTQTDGGSSKSIAGQKIVLKTAAPDDGICFSNFGWSGRTYTENIDLVLEAEATHKLRFNTFASGKKQGSTKYNKNVNIYLNKAKGLSFNYFDGATFGGGLNIFNNTDILINDNTPGYADLPENTWILNNKSDKLNPLVATDVAGEFVTELDTDFVKVTAKDSKGNVYETTNGEITLTAGEYEIDVVCVGEHQYGTYTKDNNASCGKNETESATCQNCGVTISREIENTALSHEYSSVVDKVCNNCEEVRVVTGNHLIKDSISGEYVLYEDGTISQKTDLVEVDDKTIYVVGGKWQQKTTIIKDGEKWLYIKEGVWDNTYCGIVTYQNKTIYIKNGEWDNTYLAVVEDDSRWYYVENGIKSSATGIFENGDTYVYVRNGKWDNKLTSLVNYLGVRHYVKNGEWSNFTGLVEYRGQTLYIEDGIWNSATTTLYNDNGNVYAIKNGKWYKGKAIIYYNDSWNYVNDGYAQPDFSGEVLIGFKTYTVTGGIVTNTDLEIPVVRPLKKAQEPEREVDTWTPVLDTINTETPRIITWGDSITRGMGMAKADKYPTVMGNLIGEGYTVINGGSSGEKSHTIAARQGAYEVYLDKDIVFEDGTTSVNIGPKGDHSFILSDETKLALNSSGEAFTNDIPANKVYIDGAEYGLSVSGNNFYLKRSNGSGKLTLEKGSKVVFSSAEAQKGSYCEIFYVGANDNISSNQAGIDYIIARYRAMIERHGNDNYIIIIPQWDRGFVEPLKAEFGDKAFDLRGELCSNDLSMVGLEPTEVDIAEQKACIIPTVLKYENNPNDSLHLNAYGYKMMGTLLYEHGVKLGYWK